MDQTNLKATAADAKHSVLRITRRFAAPREAVFKAFTDVEVFKKWWGPKGFTCPTAEIDARPGGRFHAEMLSPDGITHIIEGVFQEVTPPARLVVTWAWQNGDYEGLETLVTLEFDDHDGETELRLTHEELADELARERHSQGWSSSFDCLDEILGG